MSKITLAQANEIIAGVFAKAAELKMPPMCAAVVDAGGHLISMQRQDGVSIMRGHVCQAKAWSAVAMGINTAAITARYESGTREEGFINALNAFSGGRVITLPGGVLAKDDSGEVCGGVGVSGAAAEDDEICARAGVETAGFTPA